MIAIRQFLVVGLICVSFTLFSLYLHTASFTNTMINYTDENNQDEEFELVSNGFLNWAVDYHKTLPDFKKRPITTYLIEVISDLFDFKIGLSFVLVNFVFHFFCGFLLYYLAKLYSLSHIESLLGVVFYYCSFSILLAYFIPIATYDEPIQYFFILLSFIALRKKVMSLFVLFFTLAIITRENTLILLPGIAFYLLEINYRKVFQGIGKTILVLIPMVLPVVFYIIYLFWFYGENPEIVEETKAILSNKFSKYEHNFDDLESSVRTVLSFSSIFLLPLFLLRIDFKKKVLLDFEASLIRAFWATFFINTLVVLLSVYAEESRVFALPLFFLFPFFGKIIKQSIVFSKAFLTYLFHLKRIAFLVVAVAFSWVVFDYVYGLTTLKMDENLYIEYNVFVVFVIALMLSYEQYSKNKTLSI